MIMKKALVFGAGGFIGSHLVKRLKTEGFFVVGVDLKYPEFSKTEADVFYIMDLRISCNVNCVFVEGFDEVYQLAADMGGAGYIFSGDHDANVMHNSALINLNVAKRASQVFPKKLFFSSSACIYPQQNQINPDKPNCAEATAYPANPDSEYGWEKLFSERLFLSYQRNYGVDVRIARFHNIFGEEGSWNNGKEKAPAAICRKVAETPDNGTIEIWGDGMQTRSFLYIDACLDGVRKLMDNPLPIPPVNIGSDEMVSINELVAITMEIAGKTVNIHHVDGPLGVRGRSSDNTFIKAQLGWVPVYPLRKGIKKTYNWINTQVNGK